MGPKFKPVTLPVLLGWGSVQGAAAWGAYAVIEFVVSSIFFGIIRPYAVFTTWHWSLTGMLLLGFLGAGILSGAVVGLVVWLSRRGASQTPQALENGAGLTVTLAFSLNLLFGYSGVEGYGRLLLAAAPLAALQAAALFSEEWRRKAGFLTNYWISSGLLLGLGTFLRLRELPVAGPLGVRLDLWSWVLAASVFATAAASVVLGRRWQPRLAEGPSAQFRLCAGSLAVTAVLLIASGILSMSPRAGVEAASEAGSAARTNVVVIVMDTVRADHLSVYGYDRDTTPHLKALARDSALYPNAISSSDVTLTSHASLFTGMYGSWHGAYCDPVNAPYGRALLPQYPTLAELLKSQGYSTLAVAANMYLRSDFGLERGFDEFHIPRPVAMLPADTPYLLRRSVRRCLSRLVDTTQFDRLFSLGEDIDAQLFAVLGRHGREPFFAFLNYMDAHFPYVPPAPYNQAFPGQKAGFTQEDLELDQGRISEGKPASPVYLPHCLSKYDGGVAYVDAQVGKVVDWLKRHHAYENTMIVVASDHGEAFGERNRIGHGNSPYQNVVHVALMIKYPGGVRRGAESTPVSLIDVAPTVLRTLGLQVPATMQGRDLNHPEALAQRTLFNEAFPCPVLRPPECRDGCTARSVYQWPYKFITSSNGRRELFDLSRDPLEQHTLYAQQRPLADKMRADLELWSKLMPAQAAQKHTLSHDDLQRLKSLGYVQ